ENIGPRNDKRGGHSAVVNSSAKSSSPRVSVSNSWKISSTQVTAGGLFVDDAVFHHMHEVPQRLHRAQRVAIHHNDVRGLPRSNRAQVVALQQLRRPESGRADGVHAVHSQTDKGV